MMNIQQMLVSFGNFMALKNKPVSTELIKEWETISGFKINTKVNDKTLVNSTASIAKENVKDIIFWGDGDAWKLIGKASSKSEGWMKSTKAYQLGNGCLIQVTTQQGDNVAEAITFAPEAYIIEEKDDFNNVINRKLK